MIVELQPTVGGGPGGAYGASAADGSAASRGARLQAPPVVGCWRLARRRLPVAGRITPDQLQDRLERLIHAGFRFLAFEEFCRKLRCPQPASAPQLLLTFDHPPAAFVELVWPVLRRLRIAPVLFVTSGTIGRRRRPLLHFGPTPEAGLTWAELAALAREGASVQCHGHTGARLTQLPPEIAFGDLMRSRREVELRLGTAPLAMSYPGGAVDESVADLAAKAGFTMAFTRSRRRRPTRDAWTPAMMQMALPRHRLAPGRAPLLAGSSK